jgi:hypothetical protein
MNIYSFLKRLHSFVVRTVDNKNWTLSSENQMLIIFTAKHGSLLDDLQVATNQGYLGHTFDKLQVLSYSEQV